MVEDAISFWTDIQRYEDKLAADPRSLCFVELSELYRKLGLLDDAVSVAKKGSDLHPDYPAGFYALGTACHAKGLQREAREALERTVQLEPGHLEASRLLSQLYVEGGELPRAGKLLREILRQHPGDVEADLLLRSIGGERGNDVPEEEQLEEVEELEEVEVIEELTELLEEPPAPQAAPAVAQAVPVARQEAAAVRPVPAPASGAADPFAIFEEESPLWDVQASDQSDFFAPPPAAEPSAAQHPARDPLTTATLAELYVTQGFVDKALGIYQELLGSDPANQSYRARCAELEKLKEAQEEAPSAQGAPSTAQRQPSSAVMAAEAASSQGAPGDQFESELRHWLENIRRRRDGV